MGMARSSPLTSSSTARSATTIARASTRWRKSASTEARTAAGSPSTVLTVSTLYLAALAARLKCIAIEAGPKSTAEGVMRPIVRVRRVTSARAAGEGL